MLRYSLLFAKLSWIKLSGVSFSVCLEALFVCLVCVGGWYFLKVCESIYISISLRGVGVSGILKHVCSASGMLKYSYLSQTLWQNFQEHYADGLIQVS